jgi:hypothetical protein
VGADDRGLSPRRDRATNPAVWLLALAQYRCGGEDVRRAARRQPFVWVYTFDQGAHDFNVTATRSDYRGAIQAGSLAIDGYVETSRGGTIVVDDGLFGSGVDRYTVEIDKWNGSVVGPLINGRFPYAIGMELDDPTDSALTTDLLTGTVPTIGAYSKREFVFSFAQSIVPAVAFGVQRVYGTVDSITEVREIPEPPTALLVLAGLLAAISGVRMWGWCHFLPISGRLVFPRAVPLSFILPPRVAKTPPLVSPLSNPDFSAPCNHRSSAARALACKIRLSFLALHVNESKFHAGSDLKPPNLGACRSDNRVRMTLSSVERQAQQHVLVELPPLRRVGQGFFVFAPKAFVKRTCNVE